MKPKRKLTTEELNDRAYTIAVAAIAIAVLSFLLSIFGV